MSVLAGMHGRIGSSSERSAVRYPEIDLAMVGRLIRCRWQVLTALALLGAVLGFGLSFVLSPGYVSDSKVVPAGRTGQGPAAG